jgi:hypothetical protein
MKQTFTNLKAQITVIALFAFMSVVGTTNAQTSAAPVENGLGVVDAEMENVNEPGLIYGDQEIAKGEMPQMLLDAEPASGGHGEVEYIWMEYVKIGKFSAQWYPIPSATSSSFQPGPLTKTTQFMRCARRAGSDTFLNSNVVTVQMANTSI